MKSNIINVCFLLHNTVVIWNLQLSGFVRLRFAVSYHLVFKLQYVNWDCSAMCVIADFGDLQRITIKLNLSTGRVQSG